MNGPEHYAEAERLLSEAAVYDVTTDQTTTDLIKLTASQVHATLALAAATVATKAFGPQEAWGGHAIEAAPEWQEATR